MDKLDYRRFHDMTVKMHCHSETEPANRLLRGRALLNPAEGELTFVENDYRRPRSVEVGRTEHSRFIRRPDNSYVITFRVRGDEKYLRSDLQAEVRDIVQMLDEDRKQNERQQKLQKIADNEKQNETQEG